MANYQNLKAAISAAIRTNGNQEITGQVLQNVLNSIVSVIGANYTFAGVATPATNPGTPDQNVFYIATQGGTYTNFGATALPEGISLLMWNGSWTAKTIMYNDGGVFDISVYKSTGGTLAKFADLGAALGTNGANIPAAARKGGMSVKFVQSSDNKYVQFRYMSSSTAANDFTNTANWQGVDAKPTTESNNLVESGGTKFLLDDNANKLSICLYGSANLEFNIPLNSSRSITFPFTFKKDIEYKISGETSCYLNFFNEENTFLFQLYSGNNYTATFIPSSDIKKFRIENYGSIESNNLIIERKDSNGLVDDVETIKEKTSAQNDALNPTLIGRGYYVNGNYTENLGYYSYVTRKLCIDDYDIKKINISYKYPNQILIQSVVFFDETETYISGMSSTSGGYLTEENIVIPENAVYFAFTLFKEEILYLKPKVEKISKEIKDLDDDVSTIETAIEGNIINALSPLPKVDEGTWFGYVDPSGVLTVAGQDFNSYKYDIRGMAGELRCHTNTKNINLRQWAIYKDSVSYRHGDTPTSLDFTIELDGIGDYLYISYSAKDSSASQVAVNRVILSKLDKVYDKCFPETPTIEYLLPKYIYTVFNDITEESEAKNFSDRNYDAVLYLDNLIKTRLEKEPTISLAYKGNVANSNSEKIENVRSISIPIPFAYKNTFGANADVSGNPQTYETLQGLWGNNFVEEVYNAIINEPDKLTSFSFKNRCVKNSVTANAKINILMFGDSITYGQDAFFYDRKQRNTYPMLLNELFLRDRHENNNSGYELRTIGKRYWSKQIQDLNVTQKTYYEGYQGECLRHYLHGGENTMFQDENGYFSIKAYVSKYRTCDDNGNRLYFDANQRTTGTAGESNIGYLADGTNSGFYIGRFVTNTESFDVFTPNYVFLFMGTNEPITEAQYNEFIEGVHEDNNDIVIGLGLPRSAGTYFPSKYPEFRKVAHWINGLSTQQIASQSVLCEKFWDSEHEADNIFVVPTYFVNPDAWSCACTECNDIASAFTENYKKYYIPFGQANFQHVSSYAHSAYAYQLYAWIKWVIANNI